MSDRLLDAFRRLLDVLQPSLLYYAVWSYRVVTVSGTGPVKVDARAISPLCPMPDLAGMVIWPGPSGCYASPAVGSVVRIAFVDGSPSQPAIVGLDPNSAPTQVYLSGVGPAVGRVGDAVSVTFSVANFTPLAAGLVCASAGSPPTVGGPAAPFTITGTITAGSTKVQSP